MKHLRHKIENMLADPEGRPPLPAAGFLTVLAWAYEGLMHGRAAAYRRGVRPRRRLPCAVVSIGNLAAGGTGKTPMAIYVADLLQNAGYRVAVVSRGYGGSFQRRGGIVSDGRRLRLDAAAAGDEPVLIARRLTGVPVLVGRDRFAAGMRACKRFASQVLVLDDAFQHLALARDVDLVMLDWRRPLANGRMLPRGLLRESPLALRRADGLVFTRCPVDENLHRGVPERRLKRFAGMLPAFYAAQKACVRQFVPSSAAVGHRPGPHPVKGLSVWAFSGIARNRDFHRTLVRMGCRVVGCSTFRDHHHFRDGELHAVLQAAKTAGADMLATTEKDFCRLDPERQWPLDLAVLGIDPDLGSQRGRFENFLVRRVQAALDRLEKDLPPRPIRTGPQAVNDPKGEGG